MTPDEHKAWYLVFKSNQAKVLEQDDLRPYWGKRVAWSWDGTHIVAAGDTVDEVFLRLEELGIDPCSTVGDFIHDPNVCYIL